MSISKSSLIRALPLALAALVPALAADAMGRRPASLPAGSPPLPAWLRAGDGGGEPRRDELRLSWLGTAGFELRTAQGALLIDPYYSRTPLLPLLTGPARPDEEAIRSRLRPVQAIFVGHGHFDHMLDAPTAARLSGATLYASAPVLALAAQEGLPAAQRRAIAGGDVVRVGDMSVEVVTSRHSDMPTQRLAGGEMRDDARLPMGFLEYKNGPVFGFLVRWRGRTLYHAGSAAIAEAALAGKRAETVLVCLSGWTSDRTLFARIWRTLRPAVIAPMHHDDFFKPFTAGFVENPLAFHREALGRIREDAPGAAMLDLRFFDDHRLRAREAP